MSFAWQSGRVVQNVHVILFYFIPSLARCEFDRPKGHQGAHAGADAGAQPRVVACGFRDSTTDLTNAYPFPLLFPQGFIQFYCHVFRPKKAVCIRPERSCSRALGGLASSSADAFAAHATRCGRTYRHKCARTSGRTRTTSELYIQYTFFKVTRYLYFFRPYLLPPAGHENAATNESTFHYFYEESILELLVVNKPKPTAARPKTKRLLVTGSFPAGTDLPISLPDLSNEKKGLLRQADKMLETYSARASFFLHVVIPIRDKNYCSIA